MSYWGIFIATMYLLYYGQRVDIFSKNKVWALFLVKTSIYTIVKYIIYPKLNDLIMYKFYLRSK